MENIGFVYTGLNLFPEAHESFKNALSASEEVSNTEKIIKLHNSIGQTFIKQKKYQDAIASFHKSAELAISNKDRNMLCRNYENLAAMYDSLGNVKLAHKFFKLYHSIQDSLHTKESEMLYDQMKKDKEIESKYVLDIMKKEKMMQALELDKRQAEIKKQRIVVISSIVGLLIVLLSSILIFRAYLAKKKANRIIEIQNIELQQKNEEVIAQRDEIETQRDLGTKQKDHIEEIHKEVTDSINYAERIQRSFLATKELLDENLNASLRGTKQSIAEDEIATLPLGARNDESNYFIFFHPKDVVSGDFYWASKLKNGNFALATADSTGHGVPGAIMSILNISSLKKSC